MWLLIYCSVCAAHKPGRRRACGRIAPQALRCPVNKLGSPGASPTSQLQTPSSKCSTGSSSSLWQINLLDGTLAQDLYPPPTSIYLYLLWCMSCRPPPGYSLHDTHTCSCPWCWHRSESTASHCLWHTRRYLERSKSRICPKARGFRPQMQ